MPHALPSLAALRAYEAYVRLGSMTAASEELQNYPSNVSRHIQRLELEMGVALVEGTRRYVRPTPAGLTLAAGLTSAFEAMGRAVDGAKRADTNAKD